VYKGSPPGHDVATTVTPAARRGHRNRPSVGANRAAFVTSHPVLTAMAKDAAGQGRRPRPRKPQTRFADVRGRLAARWFARPRPVPCSGDKRNYRAYRGADLFTAPLTMAATIF
jgi:hypothetical protein